MCTSSEQDAAMPDTNAAVGQADMQDDVPGCIANEQHTVSPDVSSAAWQETVSDNPVSCPANEQDTAMLEGNSEDQVCEHREHSDMIAKNTDNITCEDGGEVPDWCDSDDAEFVQLAGDQGSPPFRLPRDTHESLYSYQRQGVAWLARMWRQGQGGILADEMGLGKTVQICALLNGARKAGATHVLVLLPVTLLEQWEVEARKWCPGWPVYVYYGTPAQRALGLREASMPQGGILLTTYAMLSGGDNLFEVKISDGQDTKAKRGPLVKKRKLNQGSSCNPDEAMEELGKQEAEVPSSGLPEIGDVRPWDVVVCDEAHRMKNISSLLGKSLRKLRSNCRLLLTGTPVQNALQDLWALMDFAQPGLLGNHATFVKHFSEPIDRGSVRGASAFAVALKQHLAQQLRQLIAPHLLRRTKVSAGLLTCTEEGCGDQVPETEADMAMEDVLYDDWVEGKQLPPKRETVIWLLPSDEQVEVYQKALEKSEIIREAAAKSKLGIEVFRAIGLLKRLCNHPLLALPIAKAGDWQETLTQAVQSVDTADIPPHADPAVPSDITPDSLKASGNSGSSAVSEEVRAGRAVEMMLRKLPRDANSLLAQSAKLRCLALLLPSLASRGHRTLVFSQSVKMLDLVQVCVLRPYGLRCLRIDGQTDPQIRGEKVAKFEKQQDRFQCMLLTTSVGGVGLNLTSADRVVLIDPAWNPATDAQAVHRAHRIGQTKEVRVYRLVTSGLIEDKMFRLQVYKNGLTQTALEADQQSRFFTAKEIRALFEWTDPAKGQTRQLLIDKLGDGVDKAVQTAADEDGAAAEGWLGEWMVAGISDFAAVFGSMAGPEEECNVKVAAEVEAAKKRLDDAEEKVQQAGEARKAVEDSLQIATCELDVAVEAIAASGDERAKADETIKERRTELTQARRAESAAQQRLEKAIRAQASVVKQHAKAEESLSEANAANIAAMEVEQQANEVIRSAEERMSNSLSDLEGILSCLLQKTSSTSWSNPIVDMLSRVGAADAKLKAATKAAARVKSALDKVAICQAELEVAEEALTVFDEEANTEDRVGAGSSSDSSPSKASPKKACTEAGKEATLAAKARQKERQRLEQARGKAEQKAEGARDAITKEINNLTEAGMAMVESFHKAQDQHVRMEQVKAAQIAVRGVFRHFAPSWAGSKKAQDLWSKATRTRKKQTLRAQQAAAAFTDAEAALSAAARETSAAEAEDKARREEGARIAALQEEAEQERSKAETAEAEWKRRREELKADAAAAKEALKPARAAEKAAIAERHTVYVECAKVERSQMKMERAKSDAIKRLTTEDYNANQVQQAYEQKRKAANSEPVGQDN